MELEQLIEKLENIKWLDKEIKELKLEIESLDSGVYKRSYLSASPLQKSSNNYAENKIVSTIKLKEDLEERLEKVINERLESVRMIDKNPYALERTVLRLYYVRALPNWDVADPKKRKRTISGDFIEKIISARDWPTEKTKKC